MPSATTTTVPNLNNMKRDLRDTLDVIIANTSSFISLFPTVQAATNHKHEWLEGQIKPQELAYSVATNVGVFTVTSSAGWNVGALVRIKGQTAVLRITATTATTITTEFVAANGSSLTSSTIPVTAGTLVFDSQPTEDGSTEGANSFWQSSTAYNNTQILRREIKMSRSAMNTLTYGNENALAYQIENGLRVVAQELNHIAIFGSRTERTSSVNGSAGGIYFFGTQEGGLSINASSAGISMKLINDAAQNILEQGGDPSVILCSPTAARVFSSQFNQAIQTSQADPTRGTYVSSIISDVTGKAMRIFAEPKMSGLKDVWVMDPSGFGLSHFPGIDGTGAIGYADTTVPGMDGSRVSILGEMTLEFRNAKQRLCRIKNIEDPATTLTTDGYMAKVKVVNADEFGVAAST